MGWENIFFHVIFDFVLYVFVVLFGIDLRHGNDKAQGQEEEERADDADKDDDDDDNDDQEEDEEEEDGPSASGRDDDDDDGQDFSNRATVELMVGIDIRVSPLLDAFDV